MTSTDAPSIGDIVAVWFADLSRPLYGTMLAVQGNRVTVHIESDRGEATLVVDADQVTPWLTLWRR